MLDISAYFSRIRYFGPADPTAQTLRGLHRAHMLTVPFENLDIAFGRAIACETDSFVQKVVDRRRGGFCYELNGAFAALLAALGFRVTLLSARVAREDGSQSPEFDHLALQVDLDEPWLADVGFGDSFIEPLLLRPDVEQVQSPDTYRLTKEGESFCMQRSGPDGAWKREYVFTLTPRSLQDFSAMCRYHQTSPDSPFTTKKICSLATRDGRITLTDNRLIVTRNLQREKTLLKSELEWEAALREHFNIVLDAGSKTKRRA